MSIQRYEHQFVDPIACASENIQSTVYDGHGGYGYVDFANLNIYDGYTSNGVNETPQYHVMTAASTSTVAPPRSILVNKGRNSAKPTPDNNINRPYL